MIFINHSSADSICNLFFDGVMALGKLGRQDLKREMMASSVYVCCSVYEPFGLVAVEAGLCGCAVVCRDIASLREVWGQAALYFADGNDLRAVLLALREDTELLGRRQGWARERAGRYSVDAMTEEYLRVYGDVMDSTHRDSAAMNGARGIRG